MATYEYAFVWAGQENGRPWGTKAEGFTQTPHLNQKALGIDLVNIVIEAGENSGNGKVLSTDTILEADEWVGAQLRPGTVAAPVGGYATVVANGQKSVTVNWVVGTPSTGTYQGYLVRTDPSLYPNVRVLVPYQPEGPDIAASSVPYPSGTVRAPGFTVPATITSYEDLGLFLEHSFLEGIASHGASEATDSTSTPALHPPASATASTLVLAAPGDTLVSNAFAGGYLRVTHGASLELVSWARIDNNDASTFTLDAAGWQGDGTPTDGTPGPSAWLFEAWVPHYDNSPHAYTPGVGFRYPGNDLQPAVFGDGRIRNHPRGIFTQSYGDRYGAMLEFGWRMSVALGKRINLIHLSVNESTLIQRSKVNDDAFAGSIGWWDSNRHSHWNPSSSDNIAARLKKMIDTIAPAAITMDGTSNLLRILGVVMPMGEGDAVIAAGRESYGRTLSDFVSWIRDVIDDAGLNPYEDETRIPVVHPQITAVPWESAVNDEDGLVNAAINEMMEADWFGATIDPEDSPKLTADSDHFNGVGEGLNGALMAVEMAGLVDEALSLGSEILDLPKDLAVDICNLALSHIGETAKVTSLDTSVDTSRQAALCAQFYPQARDSLLEMHNWGFALKRKALVKSSALAEQYTYAYVVPGDAQRVIAVLPADVTNDYSQTLGPWQRGFWENDLFGALGTYIPQDYALEQSPSGSRIIYTNVDNARLRYQPKIIDPARFSDLFRVALSWHLASFLAGPIMKGEEGAQQAIRAGQMMRGYLGAATVNDGHQRQQRPEHIVPWLGNR